MAMAVRMCASVSGDLTSRRVSSWGEGALLRCRAEAAEALAMRVCAAAGSLSGADLSTSRRSWGEGALLRCRAEAAEALFLSTLSFAAAEQQQQQQGRRLFYGRRGGGDSWYHSPVSMPDSETLQVCSSSQADRIASLAVRAWRKRGDADRADELYNRALELAPENCAIQANYAEFLWQCDV